MDRADREAMARKHLPLVEKLVAVMRQRLGPAVEGDEVRSLAMEGLADSISRFDPARGVAFKTFAERRIKGAIYDGLAKADWFPRRLRRRIRFYQSSEDLLRYRAETPPPGDRVETAHRLANSLRELATAYVTTYAADREPPAPTGGAEYALERKRFRARLSAYIDVLPAKQREVIVAYFFQEQTLPEIAERLGHTKSWASRVLGAALANLRAVMEEGPAPPEAFAPPV